MQNNQEDNRLTQGEFKELFGAEIPVEAIEFVWTAPDDMTMDEVRSKLRAIAEKHRSATVPAGDGGRNGDALIWVCQHLSSLSAVHVVHAKDVVKAAAGVYEPKSVYNALTYLSRTGELRRAGYGQYEIVALRAASRLSQGTGVTIERAFKDGVHYATIVDVPNTEEARDEAWRGSKVRALSGDTL